MRVGVLCDCARLIENSCTESKSTELLHVIHVGGAAWPDDDDDDDVMQTEYVSAVRGGGCGVCVCVDSITFPCTHQSHEARARVRE